MMTPRSAPLLPLLFFFVVVLLVGNVLAAKPRLVGFGKHSLSDDGKIVKMGTSRRVATTNADLEEYKKQHLACDVDFDSEGDIVLHYKKNGKAQEDGCAVDLLTQSPFAEEVRLTFGVDNGQKLLVTEPKCLSPTNPDGHQYNLLPFAVSTDIEFVKRISKGPLYINGKLTGLEYCARFSSDKNDIYLARSGLELAWSAKEKNVIVHANIIGEPMHWYCQHTKKRGEDSTEAEVEVVLNGRPGSNLFEVKKDCDPVNGKKYSQAKHYCTDPDNAKFERPRAWKITDDRHKDKAYSHLVAFYMLPRTAARKQSLKHFFERYPNEDTRLGVIENSEEAPDGLLCLEMYIKFSHTMYKLLVPGEPVTAPLVPTPTPQGPGSPGTVVVTRIVSGSALTATAAAEETIGVWVIVAMVAGALLLVAVCVVGLLTGLIWNMSGGSKTKWKDDAGRTRITRALETFKEGGGDKTTKVSGGGGGKHHKDAEKTKRGAKGKK